jgi:hypothetical protein
MNPFQRITYESFRMDRQGSEGRASRQSDIGHVASLVAVNVKVEGSQSRDSFSEDGSGMILLRQVQFWHRQIGREVDLVRFLVQFGSVQLAGLSQEPKSSGRRKRWIV